MYLKFDTIGHTFIVIKLSQDCTTYWAVVNWFLPDFCLLYCWHSPNSNTSKYIELSLDIKSFIVDNDVFAANFENFILFPFEKVMPYFPGLFVCYLSVSGSLCHSANLSVATDKLFDSHLERE